MGDEPVDVGVRAAPMYRLASLLIETWSDRASGWHQRGLTPFPLSPPLV